MPQFADFSSFFEVGIGLGVGLSLFRIPIDNRKFALIRRVDNELRLFSHQGTQVAVERFERAGELSILLDAAVLRLEKQVKDFPIISLIGSLLNAMMLFRVAMSSSQYVTAADIWLFAFVSIGWYVLMSLTIIWFVDRAFGNIERCLNDPSIPLNPA